jgi:hypothetical protein
MAMSLLAPRRRGGGGREGHDRRARERSTRASRRDRGRTPFARREVPPMTLPESRARACSRANLHGSLEGRHRE